jgi:membrane associated rhomboid family serine protease
MFGTELERTWGSRFFRKYYFVTGVGAAAVTLLWSISPLPLADRMYYTATIGASGAVYGVLLAYGLTYPHRPIFLYFVFPIPARYFVMIIGAIAFFSSVGSAGGGIAHVAHLGGLVVGYLYLKSLRGRPLDELKYRWLRWKMNRARSRFDVYSGGRRGDDDSWKSDWKKHIH